jgi:hypothetical protein
MHHKISWLLVDKRRRRDVLEDADWRKYTEGDRAYPRNDRFTLLHSLSRY